MVIRLSTGGNASPDACEVLDAGLTGAKPERVENNVWFPGIWGTNPAAM